MTGGPARKSTVGVAVAIGCGVGVALGEALDDVPVAVAANVGLELRSGCSSQVLLKPSASPASGRLRTGVRRNPVNVGSLAARCALRCREIIGTYMSTIYSRLALRGFARAHDRRTCQEKW